MSGLFGGLSISASGMTAERLRMDVIAENLANAESTRGADGQPYRRKSVVLGEAGGSGSSFADVLNGVRVKEVAEDKGPGRKVFDPSHPDADATGYVTLPNVNTVTEMVDLITATRGYEANVQAMNAAKQMFIRTLDLLR
jgi:flagellar basal-body rod protein FlgC